MIAWLEGVLREKAPTRIVLDVRGVGYELLVPLSTFDALPDPGKTVSLLVHTAVREESILSGMEPLRLLQLLRDADAKGLRKAPGVGPKLAERIVVELRDEAEKLAGRLGTAGAASGPGTLPGVEPGEELLSALVNLGYPRSQAERVVESALAEADRDSSLEELIRVALRRLAR